MPTNTPPPSGRISVVAAASQALERVGAVLFQPFNPARWLAIGFCAWLAALGESWGGGGGPWGSRESGPAGFNREWERFVEFVRDNLYWIVPAGIALVTVALAVALVLVWLSSRGQFMFLHNVATQRAEVVLPWKQYRRHANSLFWFRLLLYLLATVLTLPFAGAGILAIFGMVRREEPTLGGVLGAGAAITVALALGFAFFIIGKLTRDFVVPIMWLHTPSWRAAWGELAGLMRVRPGGFLLYLLFHFLLSLVIGVATVLLVIFTCCVAGCLLALPYLGTVLYLPVLVFLRAYPACFLAQFGPSYDVFQPAALQPVAQPPE